MKNIGLDLSTACSGYSIFENGKLINYGQIKPKTTLSTIGKIEYIVKEFVNIFEKEDLTDARFTIEDIFLGHFAGKNQVLGFAGLGRISGAIMAALFLDLQKSEKDVILIKAISARPKVGLKGNCQKAEVQVWVLDKFFNKDVTEYNALIDAVIAKKGVGDIDHKTYKKRMEEISKIIEKETGITEDVADAILLGAIGE